MTLITALKMELRRVREHLNAEKAAGHAMRHQLIAAVDALYPWREHPEIGPLADALVELMGGKKP